MRTLLRATSALFVVALIHHSTPVRADVIVTTVGNPTFVPVDFRQFAAPIGTAGTGYAESLQSALTILPPPNHVFNPTLGVGPGTPHAGPYNQEIGQGVAAAGFVEATTFTTAQYSDGSGVFLAFMLVPGPNSSTGSSPDFTSGPIIPNALFPLTASGGTFTDGSLNGVPAQFQVPAIDQVPGFAGLDGHSHIPLFYFDNFDFATRRVTGDYEFRISLLDVEGNGYQITGSFQVVPEPASLVILGTGTLGLLGYSWRRRRAADV